MNAEKNHPNWLHQAIFIFLDDNDLTVSAVKAFFGNTEWNIISHGLYLNIFEAQWDQLDREPNERHPKFKEEL